MSSTEMPDNATVFLGTCCKLHVISSLCCLVRNLRMGQWGGKEWGGGIGAGQLVRALVSQLETV